MTGPLPADGGAADWLSALAADLAAPRQKVDLLLLAELWTIDHLRFVCDWPQGMEDYPELALRVRGAFGRRLAEQHEGPRRRSGARLPRAYDVLFSSVATRSAGLELPKPVGLRVSRERDCLIVDLRLFGAAGLWLEEAADAMARALEGGIALHAQARLRASARVRDVGIRRTENVVTGDATTATMTFLTPAVVRGGGRLSDDPRSLLRAAPRIVASLARWQGLELVADWAAVSAGIASLRVDDTQLRRYEFQRFSRRSGDTAIPVRGYLGALRASGALGDTATFLRLAETLGVGSHVSLGLGAFDLACA